MQLHDLKPNPGSTHRRKLLGRGIGSGKGKTAGRGHKGQKARGQVHPRFEGGQTPLQRRLPLKRGFRSPNKKYYTLLNVGELGKRFDGKEAVTPELMIQTRAISDIGDGIKILGNGEIKVALKVSAHLFSKTAEEKIIAAGGEVTRL